MKRQAGHFMLGSTKARLKRKTFQTTKTRQKINSKKKKTEKRKPKADPTYLDGVEPAVAVEGEADDVGGVLVPAGVDGVTHDVSGLREDLLHQDLLSAQGDPLAQVGRDSDHQTLAGRRPPGLSLRLPALQLPNHRGQLVEASLLVQLGEVLTETCVITVL